MASEVYRLDTLQREESVPFECRRIRKHQENTLVEGFFAN